MTDLGDEAIHHLRDGFRILAGVSWEHGILHRHHWLRLWRGEDEQLNPQGRLDGRQLILEQLEQMPPAARCTAGADLDLLHDAVHPQPLENKRPRPDLILVEGRAKALQ